MDVRQGCNLSAEGFTYITKFGEHRGGMSRLDALLPSGIGLRFPFRRLFGPFYRSTGLYSLGILTRSRTSRNLLGEEHLYRPIVLVVCLTSAPLGLSRFWEFICP